jgi:hydroxymethylpyrimidine/phosphomethylpyrimidine kinase
MIDKRESMEEAARILKDLGPEVVVITGGHLEGIAIDLYYDGEFHAIEGEKMRGEYHGTGCAFSAAITALLARGRSPLESVREAKNYVSDAIRKASHPGRGMGLLNL